jgi:hypothetical protein
MSITNVHQLRSFNIESIALCITAGNQRGTRKTTSSTPAPRLPATAQLRCTGSRAHGKRVGPSRRCAVCWLRFCVLLSNRKARLSISYQGESTKCFPEKQLGWTIRRLRRRDLHSHPSGLHPRVLCEGRSRGREIGLTTSVSHDLPSSDGNSSREYVDAGVPSRSSVCPDRLQYSKTFHHSRMARDRVSPSSGRHRWLTMDPFRARPCSRKHNYLDIQPLLLHAPRIPSNGHEEAL